VHGALHVGAHVVEGLDAADEVARDGVLHSAHPVRRPVARVLVAQPREQRNARAARDGVARHAFVRPRRPVQRQVADLVHQARVGSLSQCLHHEADVARVGAIPQLGLRVFPLALLLVAGEHALRE
jgi:hypothetical protein